MKANGCTTCKHGKSMWEHKGFLFDKWERFYVVCYKLEFNEITPILHNFICTCGCASWESSDDFVERIDD